MSAELSIPRTKEMNAWRSSEYLTAAGIAALIVGGVVWFWGLIVPFLLSAAIDTLHFAYVAGILVAIAYLCLGKRPRLMFRVMLRSLTNIWTSVYAIDIIKDNLVQMKKRRDKMNEQISEVAGQISLLKRTIEKNHQTAQEGFSMARTAKARAANADDEAEQLRMALQVKMNARKAERRENANIGYTAILTKLQKLYDFLSKYAAHIDFFIEDTADQIDQATIESKTTNSAFGAMKTAMAVMRGNATEEDIYDQAMESIETDVSRKLGIMDDLTRVSQNFMDGLDVKEGAVDDQALQALNQFEKKLLSSGDSELEVMLPGKSATPVPVTRSGSDYSDFFSK